MRSLGDNETEFRIDTPSPRVLSNVIRNALPLLAKDIRDLWRVYERDDCVILRRTVPVILATDIIDVMDVGTRIMNGESLDIHGELTSEDIESLTSLAQSQNKTLSYFPELKRLVIK